MTPERWERIKEIVGEALDLDRSDRPALLDRKCDGDAALRADVETLLRADDTDTPFLELDKVPDRLGPYRVVREIGRGGMGAVYLAERDDGQFEQRVAIKVIKRGMDTDAVLRRFYAERRILARLQHPNITRLLDGGMFDGRPYFVMEYLEGEPIVAYCLRTGAPRERRIALFLAVCDAVEHAHRNLILHRDLKPGNILVEANGTPKLLDFGIAKLLEQDGSTEQTIAALRAMTPQAASPEQVRGDTLTTASDVYALGLLLYELLLSRPPYIVPMGSPAELARIVCEQPVAKPGVDADLDNIILKALEKEPVRRYQGPAELAADLRRYLAGQPVHARPGGAGYRLRKFIARNRRVLAIAALVTIAIGAAVTDAIVQGRRAQRRFDDLRKLAGTFIFEFHDAIATLPGSTPARELVVERALQYLNGLASESSGDPKLRTELAEGYIKVGSAQGLYFESNLGKWQQAADSFQKALDIYERLHRERPDDVAARVGLSRALLALSTTFQIDGRADPRILRNAERIIDLLSPAAKAGKLDAPGLVALGQAYFSQSESKLRAKDIDASLAARMKSLEVLRLAATKYPRDAEAQRFLATTLKRLAYIYITQTHDFAKGAQALREALQIDGQRLARDPANAVVKLDVALAESYLANLTLRSGDAEKAREILQSAIARRSEVLAADPRNVRVRVLLVSDHARLGAILRDTGKSAEARAAFDKGLQLASEGDPAAMQSADVQSTVDDLRREAAAPRRTAAGSNVTPPPLTRRVN